jgi:hypothetical protein
MDLLLDKDKEKSGVNKILVGAMLVAAALIAGALWLWTFQPSFEEQKQQQQQIVGAFTEGSPEFEGYTKNLVITTDLDRTTESPLGLGTIQMNIQGDIRNKGDKIINGLEVNVSVVDTKNQTVKEKKVKVVPTNQIEKLAPGEITHVIVPMDGFSKKDDRANVRWKVTAIRFE